MKTKSLENLKQLISSLSSKEKLYLKENLHNDSLILFENVDSNGEINLPYEKLYYITNKLLDYILAYLKNKEQEDNKELEIISLIATAKTLYIRNLFEMAISNINKALSLSKEYHLSSYTVLCYQELLKIYKDSGFYQHKPDEALEIISNLERELKILQSICELQKIVNNLLLMPYADKGLLNSSLVNFVNEPYSYYIDQVLTSNYLSVSEINTIDDIGPLKDYLIEIKDSTLVDKDFREIIVSKIANSIIVRFYVKRKFNEIDVFLNWFKTAILSNFNITSLWYLKNLYNIVACYSVQFREKEVKKYLKVYSNFFTNKPFERHDYFLDRSSFIYLEGLSNFNEGYYNDSLSLFGRILNLKVEDLYDFRTLFLSSLILYTLAVLELNLQDSDHFESFLNKWRRHKLTKGSNYHYFILNLIKVYKLLYLKDHEKAFKFLDKSILEFKNPKAAEVFYSPVVFVEQWAEAKKRNLTVREYKEMER